MEFAERDAKRLRLWQEVAESGHWWWPYEGYIFASERPTVCAVDESKRLHCEDGPALAYKDSTEVHCIHGTRLEKWIVEQPELITVEKINAESNAEIRRIMVDRYGAEKYLVDSGCESVDFDGGNNVQGGAPREIVKDKNGDKWMIGTDGSTERVYTMPVPDSVKTCEQADQQLSGLKSFKLVSEG